MSELNLTSLNKDLSIISKLSDLPNVKDGLSPDELKAKFDEGNNEIKKYINETMIPEIKEQVAVKEEIQGITLGQIPDGTLTSDKFATTIKDGIEGAGYVYKFLVANIDETKTTATDLYMTINSLDIASISERQKVLIHTPEFASTITKFYLNNVEVDIALEKNKDYEIVYTNNKFMASSFEKVILKSLILQQLNFNNGVETIQVDGKCLGAVFQSLEYHTWFKNAVFTYDEETNKTTIQNPKVGHYTDENSYAYGFGLFIV